MDEFCGRWAESWNPFLKAVITSARYASKRELAALFASLEVAAEPLPRVGMRVSYGGFASVGQCFFKFVLREPIDFGVVSVGCVLKTVESVCTKARVVLGAIAPFAARAIAAGRTLEESSLAEAAVVARAKPLRDQRLQNPDRQEPRQAGDSYSWNLTAVECSHE